MDGLKNSISIFLAHFEKIDWYRVRIIPKGADDPLPALPNEVEITPEDVDAASAKWNRIMPNVAGIMDAEIINKREFDNA